VYGRSLDSGMGFAVQCLGYFGRSPCRSLLIRPTGHPVYPLRRSHAGDVGVRARSEHAMRSSRPPKASFRLDLRLLPLLCILLLAVSITSTAIPSRAEVRIMAAGSDDSIDAASMASGSGDPGGGDLKTNGVIARSDSDIGIVSTTIDTDRQALGGPLARVFTIIARVRHYVARHLGRG